MLRDQYRCGSTGDAIQKAFDDVYKVGRLKLILRTLSTYSTSLHSSVSVVLVFEAVYFFIS